MFAGEENVNAQYQEMPHDLSVNICKTLLGTVIENSAQS